VLVDRYRQVEGERGRRLIRSCHGRRRLRVSGAVLCVRFNAARAGSVHRDMCACTSFGANPCRGNDSRSPGSPSSFGHLNLIPSPEDSKKNNKYSYITPISGRDFDVYCGMSMQQPRFGMEHETGSETKGSPYQPCAPRHGGYHECFGDHRSCFHSRRFLAGPDHFRFYEWFLRIAAIQRSSLSPARSSEFACTPPAFSESV